MQRAAWQLMACEPVVKTVNEIDLVTHELRQIGSNVRVDDAHSGLRCGQEVWATETNGEPIQIAWEWTEILPDVVALFDPMNILCNVSLVDAQGHTLARSKRMLHLNNIVHHLAWRERLNRCKQALPATVSA